MGSTVTLSVTIGNDDSGMDVEFACTPNEPPPTTAPPTTQPPPPPPPPPPPVEISLCHANPDGSYTLLGPLPEAEAQQAHGGHGGDIIPAPEGGCPQPPPPDDPPQIDVCHSNDDGTFELQGPFSPADAQALHGQHENDIIPAPEGGCESTVVIVQSLTLGALGPVCVGDTPFIAYAIQTDLDATTVELTMTDVNGDIVAHYPAAPLTGSVVYPGASANPPDWPGWQLAPDGSWQPDPADENLREGLTVAASTTSSTGSESGSGSVSYPPETDICADPPISLTSDDPPAEGGGGASSDSPSGGLPVTGSGSTVAMLLAALALLVGGVFMVRSARTTEQATD